MPNICISRLSCCVTFKSTSSCCNHASTREEKVSCIYVVPCCQNETFFPMYSQMEVRKQESARDSAVISPLYSTSAAKGLWGEVQSFTRSEQFARAGWLVRIHVSVELRHYALVYIHTQLSENYNPLCSRLYTSPNRKGQPSPQPADIHPMCRRARADSNRTSEKCLIKSPQVLLQPLHRLPNCRIILKHHTYN